MNNRPINADNVKRLQYDIITISEYLLDISERIESLHNEELHNFQDEPIKILLDTIRNTSAMMLDYEVGVLGSVLRLLSLPGLIIEDI